MWTALSMYALKETWKEKKKLRKMQRKLKEPRQIVIPDELFYSDDVGFLTTFEEVRVQDELPSFYDPSASDDDFAKYAQFEYSMGGNVKMYDNHIALSTPKKKLNKSLDHALKTEGNKRSKLGTSTDTINESMDTSREDARLKKHGEDLDFGTSNLTSNLENLDLSDFPGRLSRNPQRSADSNNDIDINKKSDRDYSPIRSSTRGQERPEDLSTTESKHSLERDYSPVHSFEQILQETKQYYKAKSTLTAKKDDTAVNSRAEQAGPSAVTNQSLKQKGEDINVLESLSRYDLTLNYVNQQNKTLQNGDYNDLDIALSDLSSDVFTDSELQFSMPETTEWTRERPNKDFYPDSPVSECAFFKTPCSSRKNSYDSSVSDESLTDMEMDGRGEIQAPIRKSLGTTNGHNGHTNGYMNGHAKGEPNSKGPPMQNGKQKSGNAPKKSELKNVKSKATSSSNRYKPGGGKGKITHKKVDYSKTAKSKVNSFRNVDHAPGGGNKKVNNGRMNQYKHVESRTDTHGIEAYSHLPAEFQEIARRLSRQDKDLRDMTGGRSRPRSRLTSRSSRGGSLSPRDRSPARHGSLARNNISASSLSLTSTASGKKRRNPSLHPRPITPSLSRSHPATSCTLYDSRSRPSSRQASRSSSPVRSRNPSPSRGKSRTGTVSNGRTSRSASPTRERRSGKSSAPGGSGYDTPRSERSKSRSRTGSRSRLDDATPVMDILAYSTSRSLFQVIPVHR